MYSNIHIEPSRIAILVGAPGSGKDRLPGVPQDMVNLEQYLLSPRGGAWNQSEIQLMYDPSCYEVLKAVQAAIADYVFVYFSGHGFMSGNAQNFLCVKDGYLEDHELFNIVSPRQLITCDSCRKFYHTISGFPEELEQYQYATGYSEARAVFNSYIINSKPGRIIIHSTSTDQYAIDNLDGHGGEFTLALLDSLYSFKPFVSGYHPMTVEKILDRTVLKLKEAGEEQIPEITYSLGELSVPFGIASLSFVKKQAVMDARRDRLNDLKRRQDQQNNQNILAGAFFAGLLIYAFSD